MLNAEDLYADLVGAARVYFAQLYSDHDLQQRFSKRVAADDGGLPRSRQIIESVRANRPTD